MCTCMHVRSHDLSSMLYSTFRHSCVMGSCWFPGWLVQCGVALLYSADLVTTQEKLVATHYQTIDENRSFLG
jgi:hypothetical protein